MTDPLDRLVLPPGVREQRIMERLAQEMVEAGEQQGTAWVDASLAHAEDGQEYTQTPADLLARAARMQRDGKSLVFIRRYLELKPGITDAVLQRALDEGHGILEKRIATGEEPGESRVRVDA